MLYLERPPPLEPHAISGSEIIHIMEGQQESKRPLQKLVDQLKEMKEDFGIIREANKSYLESVQMRLSDLEYMRKELSNLNLKVLTQRAVEDLTQKLV